MEIKVDLFKAIGRCIIDINDDDDDTVNIADLFTVLGLKIDEDKLQENEDIDDKLFEIIYKCNETIRKFVKEQVNDVEENVLKFNQCVRQVYRLIVENMEVQ